MLRPRAYPELLGKALMLDADPFAVMVDDDDPWVEGLFMTVLIGLMAGAAQIIGGWLLTLSLPASPAVFEALLRSWRTVAAGLDPAVLAESEATLRSAWGWFGFATGYGGGWGRLLLLVTVPLALVLQWALYGFAGHGVARLLGGKGSLSQTLGAVGLVVAPQIFVFLKIIPFVSISNLLLLTWSVLIAYRALEVAHELPWRRAVVTVLAPPLLLVLIVGAVTGLVASALIFGSL